MGYESNPRKLYGKLEIVYSDTEISKDIRTQESNNALVSHPNEVYGNDLVPTVKACTMDGNSTMDRTFQMLDDSCILGWWGNVLCNSNGEFASEQWLEIMFVKRPITVWSVMGDEKKQEYPVDFVVEYKRDGEVVKIEKVTDNSSIKYRLSPYIEDITSIRITIKKWSTGNACVKIMRFYDRMAEVYEGDALQMFEINEEMCSAAGNYNLSSNTITVSILNKDRKFDKGYLRALILPDRKLIPSIGIMTEEKIEYTKLGVFYSDAWQIGQDSQWVKCTGTDRLMSLQKKTYVGFPLTEHATLYDIANDILSKVSEEGERFYISTSLKNTVIANAYLSKGMAWDALQEIANAGLCKIYVDREDCIYIKSEEDDIPEINLKIGTHNMFAYVSDIAMTDFANRITVGYCDVVIGEEQIIGAEVEVNIEPNTTLELTLDFTSDIANAIIESSNANIKLSDFQSGVNACTVKASNKTNTAQNAKLTVYGDSIEITTKKLTVQDDESVRNNGITEYSHTTSDLVQSHEQAEYIAKVLLDKMNAGEGIISTEWRGNPMLKLGSKYRVTDRFGDSTDLVCEANKFTFDGGLKQEMRGRKL